ncbi:MAG: hypothetical protein EBX60_05340 [Betaproteobacteria bacterium]|nr:hypothetical protein [Betaproteobacteria bacterium]
MSWGAGPRAVQNLILAAKSRAALSGSYMVRLEDIEAVAAPVLTHRIITTFAAQAEGIDAAAHLGALQAQGSTVAVMGTGVDRCYPRRHQPLRDRIAEQGAVISALLPGQGIEKYRFLQRNQLIAALCVAVLVVQARLQSGALSTAHAAADLGKQVFAIPGSRSSKACFAASPMAVICFGRYESEKHRRVSQACLHTLSFSTARLLWPFVAAYDPAP